MNVFLVGLRGAGKSTLGRDLASRRGWRFVDLDTLTAAAGGHATAGEALAALGESEFRRAEASAFRVALSYRGQVVALGGGTPTAPGVERLIMDARTSKIVRAVYLRASPDTLRRRLAATNLQGRPSITGGGTLEEIPSLFAQRDALYTRLADIVIDTDALTNAQALDHLLAATADMPSPKA